MTKDLNSKLDREGSVAINISLCSWGEEMTSEGGVTVEEPCSFHRQQDTLGRSHLGSWLLIILILQF